MLNEDAKSTMKNLLDNIKDISDKDYQRRVWIRGEGPEVDDFDETVCKFFDICNPVLEEYKEYEISEIQFSLLNNFRVEFKKFSRYNGFPQIFIDTPEWTRITLMAKEVLEAFHYR